MNNLCKEEGGYLYRGVFIAKVKGGFTTNIMAKPAWYRVPVDSLKSICKKVDDYLSRSDYEIVNRHLSQKAAA